MFKVERRNGFSYKICRSGGGCLPEELRGGFSSESEANKTLRAHLDMIWTRKEATKERSLAKSKRTAARNRKRESDVES